MPYYEDLAPNAYLERRLANCDPLAVVRVRAVGFLDDCLPAAPCESAERLSIARTLVQFWNAIDSDPLGTECGRHGCGLCGMRRDRAPATRLELDGEELALGSGYITVPTSHDLLVAPSLVIHYVMVHGYRPPEEFLAAMKACPAPRSRAFARAMRRVGPWYWRYYEIGGHQPALWRRYVFSWIEGRPTRLRIERAVLAVLARL